MNTKTVVYLDPETHHKVKISSAKAKLTMKEYVTQLVEEAESA